MKLFFLTIALCLTRVAIAKNIFYTKASYTGAVQTGSKSQPFTLIQDCIDALSGAGDECHICAGTYHEDVEITGLHGTSTHPIIIRGCDDERPKMDGTIEIETVTDWDNTDTGNIYRAEIKEDIWQLFYNDSMMINARWPNAKWSDDSIFNGSLWSRVSWASRLKKRGYIENRDDSLQNTKLDMTGAIAILNIGSFNTFVSQVKTHSAGSNEFYFHDTFKKYHFNPNNSRYFLEDKLNLLDVPEEWFYDNNTKMLHVYTPTGDKPITSKLRGKVQSYAFEITDCSHVIIKDIDFFATTIRAKSISRKNRVRDITFHSLNFKYHSYSKRMLMDIGLMDWTSIDGIFNKRNSKNWGRFTFFNNTFYGSDGIALAYYGRDVKLENNYFERNDWTAANNLVAGIGMPTIKSFSRGDIFLRNTLHKNGASAGIRPGWYPKVKLNDVSGQCWGIIQNDGAGIQVTTKPQESCFIEQNWSHDQPKYGIRFDGQPPKFGKYGTASRNVVARCNGLIIKGNYHNATNNLAFEKINGKDSDKQGAGCTLCVLKYVRKNPWEINMNSIIENNIADVGNGGRIVGGRGKTYHIAGIEKNNYVNENVSEILVDPDNYDFRFLNKAMSDKYKNAGPYPYHKIQKEYWIPGRQLYKASSPVPPHQSHTVKKRRDALMFLQAYGIKHHKVFFGTDPDNLELLKDIRNGGNVAYFHDNPSLKHDPEYFDGGFNLKEHQEYFWRVDAVTNLKDKHGKPIIYKSEVWSFKTIE